MSKITSNSNEDFDTKEQLYSLFYELTSEIKGKEIELDEDDYIENIKSTKVSQIINYLRASIQILLKKQCDNNKNNNNDALLASSHLSISEMELYQSMLRRYEINERKIIRKHFQMKLHKDAMEVKIGEYLILEKDFEEMKTKFKYEDGKFLENDRKDNEIIILRAENTNLKKAITQLEQDNTKYIKELNDKENDIDSLRETITELNSQIQKAHKELNAYANIQSQMASSSNGTKNAQCVFCGSALGNNAAKAKDKDQPPQLKLINIKKAKQKPVNKLQCNLSSISGSVTNTNLNSEFHYSKPLISASASTSKNKTHKHNNSMSIMLDKKKKEILSKYIQQNRLLNNSSSNHNNNNNNNHNTSNSNLNYNNNVNANGTGNNFNTSMRVNMIPYNPPSQCPKINHSNVNSKRDHQSSSGILLYKKGISMAHSKSFLNYSTSKVDV